MKTKGLTRHVDELGRIVVPKEMRRKLDITEGTLVEIYMEGDTIVLKKDQTTCIFCGSEGELDSFHGKSVCKACLAELRG